MKICERCKQEVDELKGEGVCNGCFSEIEGIRAAKEAAKIHEDKMNWDRKNIDKIEPVVEQLEEIKDEK